MADMQRLQVTVPPVPRLSSMGGDPMEAMPRRRRHRHRRSFAISGDFEFLRAVEPASSAQHPVQLNTASQLPVSPTPTIATLQSPRFFVSEEPKFSSPFDGVPDAIINLDDALKTKPRSFRSHRRTESAPADLVALLNLKGPDNTGAGNGGVKSGCIQEEDDDNDDNDNEESEMETQLLSPLRPRSPTPSLVRNTTRGNNTLKINRQKQRYYHYTKQLPIQGAQIQSQSLKGQTSSGSLSSAYMQTPGSLAHTPSKQMTTTPLTPVSNGNNTRFYSKNDDKPMSPTMRRAHGSHKNLMSNKESQITTFNYESKLYDMPHTITVTKSPSPTSKTLNNKSLNLIFSQEEERQDTSLIPESLLQGEPGDVADPETSSNHGPSQRLSSISPMESSPSKGDTISDRKFRGDSRIASDSLCIMRREQSGDRKKRASRLGSLMNIFAKSPSRR